MSLNEVYVEFEKIKLSVGNLIIKVKKLYVHSLKIKSKK